MKVYDVFMYLDEKDLLLMRLAEHGPFVDHFVVVEGDHTYSGNPKKRSFDPQDPCWAKYRSKILHLVVPLQPTPQSAWANEAKQRNEFMNALPLDDEDVIHLTDVDEITSRKVWPYLLKEVELRRAIGLWHRFFYYYLNLQSPLRWDAGRLFKVEFLRRLEITADEFRKRPFPSTLHPCGWHFSYLMTVDKISKKITAFSHQEYNIPKFNNRNGLETALKKRVDLFGRLQLGTLRAIRMTPEWPLHVLENPELWKPLICALTPTDRARGFVCEIKKILSFFKIGAPENNPPIRYRDTTHR